MPIEPAKLSRIIAHAAANSRVNAVYIGYDGIGDECIYFVTGTPKGLDATCMGLSDDFGAEIIALNANLGNRKNFPGLGRKVYDRNASREAPVEAD